MQRIAKFHKVSFEQFSKDWIDTFGDSDNIKEIYDNIKLPKRATTGSAGYDFFAPIKIELAPNQTVKIPTGIRVEIDENWLNNTVGIIDSDYFHSSNEGHIFCKLTNATNEGKTAVVNEGDGFIQGIFIEYGITVDDEVSAKRDGGFGSTTKK